MGKRQRTSSLWSYFTYIDGNTAKCDICDHQLSHRSTTSNLKKHMERKHNIDTDSLKHKANNVTFFLTHPDVKDDEICEELVEMDENNFVEQSDAETSKATMGVTRGTHGTADDHKYSASEEIVVPQESVYTISSHESSRFRTSPKITNVMSIKHTKDLVDFANITRKANGISVENKTEDEFDIAGRKLSYDLRSISNQQRVIAEKLVSDIVYFAKLGKLNENSSIDIGSPPNRTVLDVNCGDNTTS